MFEDKLLVKHEQKKDVKLGTVGLNETLKKDVRNKKLTICFIGRANIKLCGPILDMLRDPFLMNQYLYPNNLEEACALLQNHSSGKKKKATKPTNENRGGQDRDQARQNENINSTVIGPLFYQKPEKEKAVAGADGSTNPRVKCYKCNSWGHYASNCPSAPGSGEQHFQRNDDEKSGQGNESKPELTDDEVNSEPKISFQHMIVAFMSNENLHSNCTNSILLHSGSNISVSNNEALLQYIRSS